MSKPAASANPDDDGLDIARETADQPEVHALVAQSDALMQSLYPADSNHLVDIARLAAPEVRILVARRGGRAVGCGAIVLADDGSAEVKRMFVDPAARGLGIGRRLLADLEHIARAEGVQVLRLETGIHSREALGLYASCGFGECRPFGGYRPDPLSTFLEKRLE